MFTVSPQFRAVNGPLHTDVESGSMESRKLLHAVTPFTRVNFSYVSSMCPLLSPRVGR